MLRINWFYLKLIFVPEGNKLSLSIFSSHWKLILFPMIQTSNIIFMVFSHFLYFYFIFRSHLRISFLQFLEFLFQSLISDFMIIILFISLDLHLSYSDLFLLNQLSLKRLYLNPELSWHSFNRFSVFFIFLLNCVFKQSIKIFHVDCILSLLLQ